MSKPLKDVLEALAQSAAVTPEPFRWVVGASVSTGLRWRAAVTSEGLIELEIFDGRSRGRHTWTVSVLARLVDGPRCVLRVVRELAFAVTKAETERRVRTTREEEK